MAQRGSGRWAKRKLPVDAGGINTKQKNDLLPVKMSPDDFPADHPWNKDGFKYTWVEPDPNAPFRDEYDAVDLGSGKPIPGWFYRKIHFPSVRLSAHDRGQQLKLSDNRLQVTGDKGYCMVRANHGFHYGTYYYEVTIKEQPEGSHCRIGWGQELANLQGPVGYDKFSYGWRSRKGTLFHDSKGKHFMDGGYGEGDVLGFMLSLPDCPRPPTMVVEKKVKNRKDKKGDVDEVDHEVEVGANYLPDSMKTNPVIKLKSFLYFEKKDESPAKRMAKMSPLIKSEMSFFKNGHPCGVGFKDVYGGSYYPAGSFYKGITVDFNFGPKFKFPPPDQVDMKWNPFSDVVDHNLVRTTMSEMVHTVSKMDKFTDCESIFNDLMDNNSTRT